MRFSVIAPDTRDGYEGELGSTVVLPFEAKMSTLLDELLLDSSRTWELTRIVDSGQLEARTVDPDGGLLDHDITEGAAVWLREGRAD